MSTDQLLERALQQAGDGIIVIDAQGRVRGWNHKCEELFGFTQAEMIGQGLEAIIPERLLEAHNQGFEAAMASGHLSGDGKARRTRAVTADGGKVYVEMTFALVTDDEGSAIGSVAVAREWVRE